MDATFPDLASARAAAEQLRRLGVPDGALDVQVLGNESEMGPPMSSLTREVPQAALFGGVGAVLGVLVGVAAALGILTEPAVMLMGENPWLAALKGAVGGGATGVLFGYILGLGMWEDDGEPGAQGPRAGAVRLSVAADSGLEGHRIRQVVTSLGGRLEID